MKISIFITSYNQRDYLREAIDSVLQQTLMPHEIIVVDDCSSDESQDLISDYHRQFPDLFVPIFHSNNQGVSTARRSALNRVSGDYVSYLDGDDRYRSTKLEKEAEILQKQSDAKLVFSNNCTISTDGTRVLRRWIDDESPPTGNVFWQTFARAFPKRSLFRMELVEYNAWKQCGFHTKELAIYEDYDMRIRLTRSNKVAYCDEILSEIRSHDQGLSKSTRRVHFRSLDRIYKRNNWMLEDLDKQTQRKSRQMFASWVYGVGVMATKEAVTDKQVFQALGFLYLTLRYRMML